MPDEIEALLRELGEAVNEVRGSRARVMGHASKLYSPETFRRRFGEFPFLPRVAETVQGDLRTERIKLRDAKEMCTPYGCTDPATYLDALDDYYKSSGRRARAEYRLTRRLVRP